MRINKPYILILAAACVIFAAGCGKTSSEEPKDAAKETTESENTSQITVDTSLLDNENDDDHSPADSSQEQESSDDGTVISDKKEILHFVDVFQEQYEVEIDPDIPKHPYDLSAFTHDGQKLKYEDDVYTGRLGIDVSHHQGSIDWKKVADQGFEFAILRIGYRGYGKEGKVNPDKKFSEYIKGAKDAGLDVGVYFFAQAVNEEEAVEEANFVIKTLDGQKLDLPVVYDPESILDDEARTDDVSGEQFTKNTVAFTKTIKDAGYEPMVYSNMLWEAFELDLKELPGIPIWYADYEPLPQTPYDFTMWQYSNEGSVAGISGVVDLDIQLFAKDNFNE